MDRRPATPESQARKGRQAIVRCVSPWGFAQFRGTTEAEFLAWLRQILAHALGHIERRYQATLKRDLSREVSLERQLAASSQRLQAVLAASGPLPSDRAIRSEQERLLAEVLERLPPDYREVIILRDLRELSHEKVACRMNRSPGAVRMLWVRALARLKRRPEGSDGA